MCLWVWQVRVWNLAQRRCVATVQAHQGFVNGMCHHPRNNYFFTVSLVMHYVRPRNLTRLFVCWLTGVKLFMLKNWVGYVSLLNTPINAT